MRGEIGIVQGYTRGIYEQDLHLISKAIQTKPEATMFSILHLAPPCVSMLSTDIYIYIYIFRLCFLASSHSALLNPIYHIIHHLYSFTSTHTHHRSRFLPFSFQYNLPNPHPHRTGIPIPVPYNTILCVISIESV